MPDPFSRQTLCRVLFPRSPDVRALDLRAPWLLAAALLTVAACSDPAGLHEAKRRADTSGVTPPTDAPVLLPVGPLLDQAAKTSLSEATAEQLVAQGAALRAQAAAIRSDVPSAPQTPITTTP